MNRESHLLQGWECQSLEQAVTGPGNGYDIDVDIDIVEIGRYRNLPELIRTLFIQYASFLAEIVWDEIVTETLAREYETE